MWSRRPMGAAQPRQQDGAEPRPPAVLAAPAIQGSAPKLHSLNSPGGLGLSDDTDRNRKSSS